MAYICFPGKFFESFWNSFNLEFLNHLIYSKIRYIEKRKIIITTTSLFQYCIFCFCVLCLLDWFLIKYYCSRLSFDKIVFWRTTYDVRYSDKNAIKWSSSKTKPLNGTGSVFLYTRLDDIHCLWQFLLCYLIRYWIMKVTYMLFFIISTACNLLLF